MGKTKIEWADETVNWITGCRGDCPYCYARPTAERNARMGSERYVATLEATGDAFHPTYHENVMQKELERLARATRRRVVFLGSMSDPATRGPWLYLDGTDRAAGNQEATDRWVQEMIQAFARQLPRHVFILLTKRPENLLCEGWPDNVWIGVSVADHAAARYRIPYLMSYTQIQVTDRAGELTPRLRCGGLFASVEPLQGGPEPGDYVDPTWLDGVTTKPGWLVIGSQTRPALDTAKVPHVVENALQLVSWAASNEVPCFAKDNLIRLAPDRDWPQRFPAAFPKEDLR